MKALFIYSLNDIYSPSRPLRSIEQMQFGISHISSVLRAAGHTTRLVVLSRVMGKRNERILEKEVREFSPDAVFCTAVSTEHPFVVRIARFLKRTFPSLYIVIGGVNATLDPEAAFDGSFDALCVGEGEYPSLELLKQLEKGKRPSGIPGMWFRRAGNIERNKPAPFIEYIDALPYPDRDMWDGWCHKSPDDYYPVLLGRGCPFDCTYCCNHALRKITQGKYVRMRTPGAIIEEISELAERFPSRRNFYLEVETIACDRAWALELCRGLERLNALKKSPLAFGVNMRITPNFDQEELFQAMQKCNFTFINVGLESGSERVRREILGRNYSNDDIVRVVLAARKFGLKINFYNLIGVPGETEEDFRMTLEINRRCLPDKTFPHIFYPYPGTVLYATCKSQGLLDKELSSELERSLATLDLPGFRRNRIQEGHVWFRYNVYKDHRPVVILLAEAALAACLSNVQLHRIYRRATFIMRSLQCAKRAVFEANIDLAHAGKV